MTDDPFVDDLMFADAGDPTPPRRGGCGAWIFFGLGLLVLVGSLVFELLKASS